MGQDNSKGAARASGDPFAVFRCADEEDFQCCQNRRDDAISCEVKSSAPAKAKVNRRASEPTVSTPRMSSSMANTVLIDPTSPSMHQASAFGDIERIQFELDNGWHVDMTDSYGRTALHHAALNGNSEACRFLVDNGARLDARARDGKTPFNYAAENCKADTLRYLDLCAKQLERHRSSGNTSSSVPLSPSSNLKLPHVNHNDRPAHQRMQAPLTPRTPRVSTPRRVMTPRAPTSPLIHDLYTSSNIPELLKSPPPSSSLHHAREEALM
mmetsp:Transcript_2914/g.9818  ORF Transcript_2914/g.9818 Transcript_2914/m.9818 type:complete len:269 (-) Transcript_2914:275-1081(-)